MFFGVMLICGTRNLVRLVFAALAISFAAALVFEKLLTVVLPGGCFELFIAW